MHENEIARIIVDVAYQIHTKLGPGLLESVYEAVITPLTYLVVNYLKRAEREDYYDRGTDFNPIRWKS